jgi:hypothetical protein
MTKEMTHDDGRNLLSRLDCPDVIEHLGQFGLGQFLSPGESLHHVRLGLLGQLDILGL